MVIVLTWRMLNEPPQDQNLGFKLDWKDWNMEKEINNTTDVSLNKNRKDNLFNINVTETTADINVTKNEFIEILKRVSQPYETTEGKSKS